MKKILNITGKEGLKTPLDYDDPNFGEDNIWWCPEDITELYGFGRGTILIPNSTPELYLLALARKSRLNLIQVAEPSVTMAEYIKAFNSMQPFVNEIRLEFIREQRKGLVYQDEGINPLAYIGEPGMGYEWDADNNCWLEFPQLGGVRIGENVRIGAFTSVKCGTLENKKTIIGDGCKIGSHCNIGHNVEMGQNCLLAHRVSVGGSTIIGDRVVIWQGATIKNKLTIGHGAVIAQGANVLHDVPDGVTVAGNPAKEV